jgi:hypothetical protein
MFEGDIEMKKEVESKKKAGRASIVTAILLA